MAQQARSRRAVPVVAFSGVSLLIVTLMHPFAATAANVALAAVLIALYAFVLVCLLGKGTLDAGVLMTVILILLCLLIPSLKKAKERSDKTKHASLVPSDCRRRGNESLIEGPKG